MSERVRVTSRATVEVMATMETCVAGEVVGCGCGGEGVPMMVSSLLINGFLGPVMWKKLVAIY